MSGGLDNVGRLHAELEGRPVNEREVITHHVLGWLLASVDPAVVDDALASALVEVRRRGQRGRCRLADVLT